MNTSKTKTNKMKNIFNGSIERPENEVFRVHCNLKNKTDYQVKNISVLKPCEEIISEILLSENESPVFPLNLSGIRMMISVVSPYAPYAQKQLLAPFKVSVRSGDESTTDAVILTPVIDPYQQRVDCIYENISFKSPITVNSIEDIDIIIDSMLPITETTFLVTFLKQAR